MKAGVKRCWGDSSAPTKDEKTPKSSWPVIFCIVISVTFLFMLILVVLVMGSVAYQKLRTELSTTERELRVLIDQLNSTNSEISINYTNIELTLTSAQYHLMLTP